MDFIKKYDGKVILQLIELMNFQQTARYQVNINEVEEFLERKADGIEERSMHRRRKYHIDGIEVELVRPIDNSHFCANCNRLRVTSDGKLKPCLLRNDNLVDVNNKEPGEIEELMKLSMEKENPSIKIYHQGYKCGCSLWIFSIKQYSNISFSDMVFERYFSL